MFIDLNRREEGKQRGLAGSGFPYPHGTFLYPVWARMLGRQLSDLQELNYHKQRE